MGKKTKQRNTRLFRKYLFIITSVILMSVILLCSSYLFLASQHWNTEQLNTLQHNSDIIAQNAEQILVRYNHTDMNGKTDTSPLAMICNTMAIMSKAIEADIFITDMNGKVVVCKDMIDDNIGFSNKYRCPVHGRYRIDQKIILEAGKGNYSETSTLGGTFADNQITTASPIAVNGETVAIVFAIEPIQISWYNYAERVVEVFLTAAVLALIVSFLTVYYLSYRLTRPLKQMSDAIRHYAAGDFSYKVKVKGYDELAELADSFNALARAFSTARTKSIRWR
jgi:methyl-accepting chemotaxis protein